MAKRAHALFSAIAIIAAAVVLAGLAFLTIDLSAKLFTPAFGVFLEVLYIGVGLVFFWEFRDYFYRKLHI